MSYDEHLISMAGGDGDALDRLATIQKANEMWMTSPHVNRDDRNTAFLLAHIREQRDQLDRVLELAHWAGKRGWQIPPATLRNTINEEGK